MQNGSEVAIRLRLVGIATDRDAILMRRFLEPPQRFEHPAEIVVGLGKVGPQSDGALETDFGIGETVELPQREAEIRPRLRIGRGECKRLSVGSFSLESVCPWPEACFPDCNDARPPRVGARLGNMGTCQCRLRVAVFGTVAIARTAPDASYSRRRQQFPRPRRAPSWRKAQTLTGSRVRHENTAQMPSHFVRKAVSYGGRRFSGAMNQPRVAKSRQASSEPICMNWLHIARVAR